MLCSLRASLPGQHLLLQKGASLAVCDISGNGWVEFNYTFSPPHRVYYLYLDFLSWHELEIVFGLKDAVFINCLRPNLHDAPFKLKL